MTGGEPGRGAAAFGCRRGRDGWRLRGASRRSAVGVPCASTRFGPRSRSSRHSPRCVRSRRSAWACTSARAVDARSAPALRPACGPASGLRPAARRRRLADAAGGPARRRDSPTSNASVSEHEIADHHTPRASSCAINRRKHVTAVALAGRERRPASRSVGGRTLRASTGWSAYGRACTATAAITSGDTPEHHRRRFPRPQEQEHACPRTPPRRAGTNRTPLASASGRSRSTTGTAPTASPK